MTFRNHISKTGVAFKFDFIVKGFKKEWKTNGNYLALEMKLRQQFVNGTEHEAEGHRKEEKSDKGKVKASTVEFGSNAYIRVDDMGFLYSNGTMQSVLKYAKEEEGPQVIILYPNFGDWMIQDPSFGINSASTTFLSISIFIISVFMLLL